MIDYSAPTERNLKLEGEFMINLAKRILVTIDNKIELVIAKALKLPVDVDIHNGLAKKEEVDLTKCHNPEFDRLVLKMRGIKK